MYNPQLEALINAALADGELSESEKMILFRKAQELGVDLAEFDMVLSAKLFEKRQAMEEAKRASMATAPEPKSNKYGSVKKCPSCGANVKSFQVVCSECGVEFHDVETASKAAEAFSEKLLELDGAIARSVVLTDTVKVENSISFTTILKWLFFWPFILGYYAIVFAISSLKGESLTPIEEQKRNYIATYSIPTSRAEMLNFMTLFSSNVIEVDVLDLFVKEKRKVNTWNKTWLQKMEYIREKASVSMASDAEAMSKIEELFSVAEAKYKRTNIKLLTIAILPAILIVIFLILSNI